MPGTGPGGIAPLSLHFEVIVRTSRTVSVESDKTLAKGLNANFSAKTAFVLNGKDWTVAEIVAALNERIAASEATDTAEIAWRTAVKDQRTQDDAMQPTRQALKTALIARYGTNAEKLKEFSFAPVKARKVTVQTKAKAQVQAAATREARNTKGKNQKKGIKGVVATPTTAASSEAPQSVTPTASKTPAASPANASNGQTAS